MEPQFVGVLLKSYGSGWGRAMASGKLVIR